MQCNDDEMTPENQVAAAREASQAVDTALGLEDLTVRLPAASMRDLEHEAQSFDMPLQVLARNILQSRSIVGSFGHDGVNELAIEIMAERVRLAAKWGRPEHGQHSFQQICSFMDRRLAALGSTAGLADDARRSMIEIAALAMAAVESLDRPSTAR